MAARQTPVMQQHAAAKHAHPDAIVFFRLGDFYEMFGDDAVTAARLLELTLTSRNKGKPDEVPMAGVPYHAAHGYIARLLELGHKVALCEQMADPSKTKGIVPREVVRVITPGLVTDRDHLDKNTNNWLAAIEQGVDTVGIALLDVSTGELLCAELPNLASLLGELAKAAPREVLFGAEQGDPKVGDGLYAVEQALGGVPVRTDDPLEEADGETELGDLKNDAAHMPPTGCRSAARALRFARRCNPSAPLPVRRIGRWEPGQCMAIDRIAQAHLELAESPNGKATTLLGVMDATRSPAGARLLRRRLLAPLKDVQRIRRRLELVELFVFNPRLRDELRAALGDVGDLERLAMRAAFGEANPRDLGALRDGLLAARQAVRLLEGVDDLTYRETLGLAGTPVDTLDGLADQLGRALVERPPAQPKDGGVFQRGYDPDLDELDELRRTGTERIVALEADLKKATGISNLKVRFTRVFGWYVEVAKNQVARAPEHWRRKQTVASGERYTTDELDELADRIAHAEEKHRERELGMIRQLVEQVAEVSERIRTLAQQLAKWDVAACLAEIAHRYDYARPEVDDSTCFEIIEGRHPVVEQLAAQGRFVPNDIALDVDKERLWILTGPHMAGKSTLLRQVALIAILAQAGSYVPAKSARIGVVDRVLSRVGASDNLAQGQSTFMVEMRETAEILRSATRQSLVIVDEIGRGTSTFDGLAIAWAVAEHLDEVIQCRSLFATHYHELTSLAETSRHAANYSVSAREHGEDIVFLHRLVRGATPRSYGIAVAKLAGLPESVLARSRALLKELESDERGGSKRRKKPVSPQLDLFAPAATPAPMHAELLETLKNLELDNMTPLEALTFLAQIHKRVSEQKS